MNESINTTSPENNISASYNDTVTEDENGGVWFDGSTVASYGPISDDKKVFNYIMCAVSIFILIMVAAIVKGLHVWHRRSQSSQRRKSNTSYNSHSGEGPASNQRQAWMSVKQLGSSLLHIGSNKSGSSKSRKRSKTGKDGGRRPTAAKNIRRPQTATVVPTPVNPTKVQPASKDTIIWKTMTSANMATTANLFHNEVIESSASKHQDSICNIREMKENSTILEEDEEPLEGQVATVYTQEQIALLDILSDSGQDLLSLPPIDVASTSHNIQEENLPGNPEMVTNNIDDFLAKLESQLDSSNVVDFSRTVNDVKALPPTDRRSYSFSNDSLTVPSVRYTASPDSPSTSSTSSSSSVASELILRVRSASDVADHRRRANTPVHLVDSDFEYPFLAASPYGKDPFSHPTPSGRRPTSSLCNLYDGRSVISALSGATNMSSTIVDVEQTSYNLLQHQPSAPPIPRRTAPRHDDDFIGKRLPDATNDSSALLHSVAIGNRSPAPTS